MRLNLALLLIIASMFASTRAARACGGGVVASTLAGTVADAQRIFISVRGGMTDVITQIGVPSTTADYGVLIPVPSAPTLDPTPIASADIDKLFARTAPTIVVQTSDDGGSGCACGSTKGGGSPSGAAQVSQPVTIGPVTAVTLTADTGAAVNTWLADNGFTLSASSQSIVSAYAGTGRYFIAIRRSDTAASGGPTSVGVHFTLAGDERGLPLKFARIGAADAVSFTILVAADDVVGPSAPFEALTLTDLDATILRSSGYYSAIASRIADQGGRAFLIEGSWTGAELPGGDWPSLRPFIDASQQVTRLSTVIRSLDLDTDVVLNQPFAGTAPRRRIVQRTRGPENSPKLALGFAVLAFAAVGARRRLRR